MVQDCSRIVRLRSGRLFWLLGGLMFMALLNAACQPLIDPAAIDETDTSAATNDGDGEEQADEEAAAGEQEGGAPETTALAGDPTAGAYVFNAARGCGCHFNRDLGALAGGNAFEGDFGTVTAANLTSDVETGLGAASDQEIADAIRFGKPTAIHKGDGDALFIMPQYSGMSDQDAADLVAYLRTLEAVSNDIPARALNFEPAPFEPSQMPPATAPTEGPERGRYLATLARCGQCHTPSNDDGSPNMDLLLAGAPFRDTVAPNLTPDSATGLGDWSEEEIVDFLKTGIYSDGTEAHPGMKGIAERNLSQMTDNDVQAIAQFLQSLPPVENLP